MRAIVSEKGQITVPKRLRERLDIRAGDLLELTEQSGQLVVKKTVPGDPVASAYGILNRQESTDATIRELRGTPDAV
jgi:AbrB family looped-hinge helix DNA binding protein